MLATKLPRRLALVLVALAAAVGVAACGSSGSSSSSSAASSPTATTTVTVPATSTATSTVTSTPSSTTTTESTATAAAVAACAPQATSVSLGMGSAGVGHIGLVLLFQNTGSTACQLSGYPGAALVRGAGKGELQVPRSASGYLGGVKGRIGPVRIGAGRTVSAMLEGDDMGNNGGACPNYVGLAVTPPNQTATHRLNTKLTICNAKIHPVVRGTSGAGSTG